LSFRWQTAAVEQARERFAGLDLMRGFAALAVLSLHIPHPPGASPVLPRAYLAVDFFFALSGFVLAHAYGARLSDIGPAGFLKIRLRRLYPLYLVALVAGATLMLGDVVDRANALGAAAEWAGALGANLLFLPAPRGLAGPEGLLYPAVGAAWSLFWELAANLLYALLARFAPKVLPLVCPVALLVLAGSASHATIDGGANWSGFALGGVRVCWAFFLGVLLQDWLSHHETRRHSSFVGWAAAALMLALFASGPPQSLVGLYDLAFVTIAVPLLVVVGAGVRLNGRSARFAAWLGGISYAVYILQSPVLKMAGTLTSVVGLPLTRVGFGWAAAICVGSTLAIAWLVQDALAARSARRTSVQAPVAGVLTTTSPVAR
jgi:peptidoglycan/LPS O-acetylase OafA/YrhL